MMNKKIKKILAVSFSFILLLCSSSSLFAQEGTNAAGGEATGNGGTASFSIGQIDYTASSTEGGSISEGIQQTYEVEVVLGTTISEETNSAVGFPNPASGLVTLRVVGFEIKNMSDALYDITGKIIAQQKLTDTETAVNMEEEASGLYLLKIIDSSNNNQEIKTFKIINNK